LRFDQQTAAKQPSTYVANRKRPS